MKSRPRRRYKKRKHDLILYLKMALIFYLTIFGVGYMSSNTSAYLSSQSVITETITADVWVVPVTLMNACGEEYTIDGVVSDESGTNDEVVSDEVDTNDEVVSDEVDANDGTVSDEVDANDGVVSDESGTNDEVVSDEVGTNPEVDADLSIEEVEKEVVVSDETEIECGHQSAPNDGSCNEDYTNGEVVSEGTDMSGEVTANRSIEVIEKEIVIDGELEIDCSGQSDASAGACHNQEESLAVEENQEEAGSITDCINTGDVSNEENDEAEEEVEIPETDKGNQNELDDEDMDSDREDDQKTDTADSEVNVEQDPTDESPHQPDSSEETTELGEMTSTDQDFLTAETLEISVD